MDHPRGRTRGALANDAGGGRRSHSKNRQWVADQGATRSGTSTPAADGERWERGGHRGGRGRGLTRGNARRFPNTSFVARPSTAHEDSMVEDLEEQEEDELELEEDEDEHEPEVEDPDPDTPEEREKFYQELVKAREVERKKAIAEGKMDDPLVPKRLEDAITMVGTCMDMCPRFERYRRERENNLFEWETKPGTKRVDHKRAVKMYERAAGDKTLPSDLRPPAVLKRTLDYLFHDLLPNNGFTQTFNFIRDRSRAVRNDFTMQHETGPLAIECHDRCARFHVLALHFERDRKGFSVNLEEQQLMNTLQSLKEYYEDQRGRYESPTELEMRVYHRLIHIRDQKERHEDIPTHITSHPVFKLTTKFRLHIQAKSAPISKTSALIVDAEGMQIFGQLAQVLRDEGSVVMIYLVACILERLFGKETIDDIEGIRGDMSIPQLIDGVSGMKEGEGFRATTGVTSPLKPSATEWLPDNFGPRPTESAIFGIPSQPSTSVFGQTTNGNAVSAFPEATSHPSVFTSPNPAAALSSPFTDGASFTTSNHVSPFSSSNAKKPAASAFSNLTTSPNPFGLTASSFAPSAFTPPEQLRSAFGTAASESSVKPGFASSSSPATLPGMSTPFASSTFTPSNLGAFTTPSSTLGGAPISSETSTIPSFHRPTSLPSGIPSSEARPNIGLGFGSSLSFAPPLGGGREDHLTRITSSQPEASASGPAPLISTTLNPMAPSFVPTPPDSWSSDGNSSRPIISPPKEPPSAPSPQDFGNLFPPRRPPSGTSTTPLPFPLIPRHDQPDTGESNSLSTNTGHPQLPQETPSWSASTSDTSPRSRPRINTNTSATRPIIRSVTDDPSPREPPRLTKPQPISLPSTPSTTSSPVTVFSPRPLLGFSRGNLRTPSAPLSPIDIPTPTTSRQLRSDPNLAFNQPEASRVSRKAPATPSLSPALSNGKSKETRADFEAKALSFNRKGSLVRRCFERWVQQATDRAVWYDACRHSDAYSRKVKRQRLSGIPLADKKRGAETNGLSLPQKKRARKRVSSEYRPPRTDEELARRFKENHEENERRWAQGSFLQVIKAHVKKHTSNVLREWRIWLSMNPDRDGTAIWLEKKFDVPSSGQWESEYVFSIPLSVDSTSTHSTATPSPGVIIFECTPLEGVTDELERKYHILDDCARLRDIIKALPPNRYFLPSVLIFSWVEAERTDTPADFLEMVSKLEGEGLIGGHHVLSITSTTKDLDRKLDDALTLLKMDVEGKLVESLTIQDVFKLFELPWRDFASEWIDKTSSENDLDFSFLARVLEAIITSLDAVPPYVLTLLAVDSTLEHLPHFNGKDVLRSESAYDMVAAWLSDQAFQGVTDAIKRDLQSYQNMGRDFPPRVFVDHLRDLVLHRILMIVGKDSRTVFQVPKAGIATVMPQFKGLLENESTKLQQAHALRIRRSPKRRALSEESESSRYTDRGKRIKLTSSQGSSHSDDFPPSESSPPFVSGHISPSPSMASTFTTDDKSPFITIAMLRALTKNVKQKYGERS